MANNATHNLPAGEHEKLSVFVLAAVVLVSVIGSAFAAGWLIGRMLL